MRRGLPVALSALLGILAVVLADRCRVNQHGHHRAPPGGDLRLGEAPRAPQALRFERSCPPPGEDDAIRRAPYLQNVGGTGGEVLWTSEPADDPHLNVAPAGRPGAALRVPAAIDREAELPEGRQYRVRLAGLEPATTYCYEVRDGKRRLAGPYGFTTAPAERGAPVRLVAFGDMGYRSVDQRAVLEQMSRVEFDFALLGGDIAYTDGTLEELEHNFFAVYAPLMRNAPFFPASGNHDYNTADAAAFRQSFALPGGGGPAGRGLWYSFDWGRDLHVVVLDSEKLGQDQIDWLERDLGETRAPWVIALFHRAPFSSGEHGPDQPTRAAFVPTLVRHHVALVVTGHEHDYERFHPRDGVTYVVSGGGGRGTRRIGRRADGSAFAAQVAHFVYIVIEEGRLRLWAIDASGRTFDTAELVGHGRRPG